MPSSSSSSPEGTALLETPLGVILLWFTQVKVLTIKGLRLKLRRPINTLFEILTPSLILLALVYGAALSPVLQMPSFSNTALNMQNTDPLLGADIINPNIIMNNSNYSALFAWLNGDNGALTNGNDLTPFSQSLLFALTVLPNFVMPTSTLSQTLQATLYTSTEAAKRTIIPGLDRFIEVAYATKLGLAEVQAKQLQYFIPYVWEMLNGPGALTFVPDNNETRMFVAYLNATSEHFEDVFGGIYKSEEDVLADYPVDFNTQLFDPNFRQSNENALRTKPLWAILNMTNFRSDKMDFTYTIRMNSSYLPRTEDVVEMFPQGLGQDFAKYVQSGFLTLEYEVGEYIRRVVRNATNNNTANDKIVKNKTSGVSYIEKFTDIFDGMLSLCGKTDTALNASFDPSQFKKIEHLFLQPAPHSTDEIHLQQFLQQVPIIPISPAMVPSASFFLEYPCLDELQMYCVDPFTNLISTDCFTVVNPWYSWPIAKDKISARCAAWLEANAKGSPFQVRVNATCRKPSPQRTDRNPTTPESYDLQCVMNAIADSSLNINHSLDNITKYANIISSLQHACDGLATGIINQCQRGDGGADADCFRKIIQNGLISATDPATAKCFQYLQSVGFGCRDEFNTVCNNYDFVPASPNYFSSGGVFCLWKNSELASTTYCKSTPLYQDIAAVAVTNATYKRGQRYRDTREVVCKFSNRIRALFSNGIVAGAFNTEEFNQNQFYKNSSAFFGLIAAMAFLFFFTSLVRSIVQDRERGSFRLFVQMGTHWSAFTASYVFLGVVTALPMSIIASFVMWGLMQSIPTVLIFSLMMAYSVSVVFLALLFSCIFDNSNTAAAASPFFMFATAIPGFTVFSGSVGSLYAVLTPAMMVVAFEDIALVAQSSTPTATLLETLHDVGGAMFGIGVLYLFLAIVYLFLLNNWGGCFLACGEFLTFAFQGCTSVEGRAATRTRVREMNQVLNSRRQAHQKPQQQQQQQQDNNNTNTTNGEQELSSMSNYHQAEKNNNIQQKNNSNSTSTDYAGAVTSHTRNANVSVGGVSSSSANFNNNDNNNTNNTSAQKKTVLIRSEVDSVPPNKVGLFFDDVWCFKTSWTGTPETAILRGCTFLAPTGCLTAVTGISGGGKTSLLSNCVGRTRALGGDIERMGTIKLFGDIDAESWQARLMSGICPSTDGALWEQLTALEHVVMVAQIKGVRDVDIATTEARVILHALGLSKEEQEQARVVELSQGIRRRVSVAMALAGGTKFLALDEPSRSVDPTGRRKIYTVLSENASAAPGSGCGGRCIVYSTNHLTEAEETADHIVLMNKLKVVYFGSPSGLLSQHLRSRMFAKAISMRRQPSCDIGALESKVAALLPSAQLLNSVGREIRFEIDDPKDFSKISTLVGELEQSDFGVGHLQVCDISLEDVVTKLIQQANNIKIENSSSASSARVAVSSSNDENTSDNNDDDDENDDELSGVNSISNNLNNNNRSNKFGLAAHHIQGNAIGTAVERESRPSSGFVHYFGLAASIIARRFAAAFSGSGLFAIVISLFCIFIALQILAMPDAPQQPLLLDPASMYSKNNGGPTSSFYSAHPNQVDFDSHQEIFVAGNPQSHALMQNQSTREATPTSDPSAFSNYALVSDFLDPSLIKMHVVKKIGEFNSSVDLSQLLYSERYSHNERKRYGALFLNDQFVSFYQVNQTLLLEQKPLCSSPPLATSGDNNNNEEFYKYCDDKYGLLYYRWRADTVLHNSTSVHALPAFVNSLLTLRAQASGNNADIRINVFTHPLQQNQPYFSSARIAVSLITSLLILVPFAFVPARYVATVVKERETGFLAVQSATDGMSITLYWLSTYAWHLIAYTCFTVASVFLMAFFQQATRGALGPLSDLGIIFFLIEMSGACFIALGYILSYFFRSHATALNFIINLSFLYGFAFVAAIASVDLMSDADDSKGAKQINSGLEGFLKLFPPFTLGKGFLDMSLLPMRHAFSLDLDISAASLVKVNIGLMALFPLYLGGLIFTVAFWRTRKCAEFVEKIWMAIPCLRHRSAAVIGARPETETDEALGFHLFEQSPEDQQKQQQQQREQQETEPSSSSSNESFGVLEADGIHKQYKRKGTTIDALRGVSLTAKPGQFLVLVSENGAGKSCLLRALCGAEKTDSGLASFDGEDVFLTEKLSEGSVRRHLGYCPESLSALDEDLTPNHLFNFMADLRCLRLDAHRAQHIDFLLRALGLLQHQYVKVRHLSSGEQRRVSVGMAMVGFPRAILLDEPSSNLDPVSRRFLWTAITCAPASEIAWVISTQHVEECHFLGTHAAILKSGRLLWHGPVNNKSDDDLMHGAVILTVMKHHHHQQESETKNNNNNSARGWEAAIAFVMDNFAPIQVVYTTNCANCYAIGSTQQRNVNFAASNNAEESSNNNNNNNNNFTPRNEESSSSSSSSSSTARPRSSSRANNNNNRTQQYEKPTVQSVVQKLIEFQEKSGCQFRFSCRNGSLEDAMLMADKQAPEHSDLQLKVRF